MPDTPPDEPKKSLFEKMGAGLPVGLTALATILAGLSTGELSRAMYWRSTAAQDQAKANDQWSLAGFKRDRSLICETTAETLAAVARYHTSRGKPDHTPTPDHVVQVGKWMRGEGEPPADDPAVRAVLQAVHDRQPEGQVLKLARLVDADRLEQLIQTAAKQSEGVDPAFKKELDEVRGQSLQPGSFLTPPKDNPTADQTATVALRYEVESRRYKAEATANQWVGFLYEVRVKTSTAESERFRQRSQNFFFAMLAAQVGGVGSSLALARKRRSALWLVAGIAGLAAVGFGAFVYLTM